MNSIWVIAQNTFKELIRDKILYAILVVAVLFVFFSLALGQLSFAEQIRITLDIGLAGIELSIVILAIFTGSTIVFREIERRTVFTLLSHPLTRSQFILGKILGLGIVVLVADLALGLLQSLISMGLGWTFEPFLAVILMGFLFQALVLISITVFLGTFMRPNISVAITIGIFIIGRTIDSLPKFVEKSESEAFKIFVTVVKYVFPNFNRWNWKSQIGLGESVIPNQIGLDSLYFLAWMLVLLSSTIIIFRRKELV